MHAILSLLSSLPFGGFGILTVLALVDAARVGADWYWFLIILAFPGLGPIAYFVVVRSPLLGARNAAMMMSPAAARRLQARRRLRVLQVQLANWRGPGPLTEAGEETLALGKPQDAEKLLREARSNGGSVEDVNFGLAQSLEMQGRWTDAVPLLEELVKVEPDSHLGEGPLHLARSLDEAGRGVEAEPVLRRVLERRTVIEAQVRLARLLLRKGEREEAQRLLAEVRNDATILPRYLKRQHRAWIRAAGRLKTGAEGLPRPRLQ
ncbi:MAG: tetratricopeptide repeat protein [Thermoanaerobaculia bacterium]